MNIWVEWWEIPNTTSGSHAQMSKNILSINQTPKIFKEDFLITMTELTNMHNRRILTVITQ